MPRSVLRTPVFLTALFWAFPVHSSGFSVPNKVSPTPDNKKPLVVANLLRGAIDALEPPSRKGGVEHLTILMVGDTGYAPSRAKPLPKGVYKYGHWQTFEETTRKIRSEISADINFANIETVISARNLRPYPKKYNFITHPNGARHLVRAGFNLFSMANNHSFDYWAEGVRDSVRHADDLLSDGLLAHAGIGLNRKQAAHVPVFERKSMRVAFGAIGIGAGGGGVQRASAKRPGQLNLNNSNDVGLLASNLKRADADIRLLSIHRGPERYIRPGAHEVRSVRNMVRASDADVMIGHHAHVTRGIEMMDGRLIVYGLGNFLHQGTANMNGKGGCQDYSLIVKAHFTKRPASEAKLAAIEVMPINSTHMQTARMSAKQGARRVSILNGLARQFDNPLTGSKGVRFMVQKDGSGLYCTAASLDHASTRGLCANYDPVHLASDRHSRNALATCGRTKLPLMIAKAGPGNGKQPAPALVKLANAAAREPSKTVAGAQGQTNAGSSLPREQSDLSRLQENPAHWPAGMPLAWQVPANETMREKQRRWAKRRYSVTEVERELRRRGLLR